MIDRQSCYDALFTLKRAGVDISLPLKSMQSNSGVPKDVIVFLRDNSPQFQFYRYIQKHQRALAKDLRNYREATNLSKLKICSSMITRACIAVEYNNINERLINELNLEEIADAIKYALISDDYSKVDEVLEKHCNSIELFYSSKKNN